MTNDLSLMPTDVDSDEYLRSLRRVNGAEAPAAEGDQQQPGVNLTNLHQESERTDDRVSQDAADGGTVQSPRAESSAPAAVETQSVAPADFAGTQWSPPSAPPTHDVHSLTGESGEADTTAFHQISTMSTGAVASNPTEAPGTIEDERISLSRRGVENENTAPVSSPVHVAAAPGVAASEPVSEAPPDDTPNTQNHAPTDILITGGSVQENTAGGTVVAQLGAVDPDTGESFTYTLAEPSSLFELVGDQVVVRAGADIDFESAASHQLGITVTDMGGLSRTEVITIGVTNQNEAPNEITVTGGSVQENAQSQTVVANSALLIPTEVKHSPTPLRNRRHCSRWSEINWSFALMQTSILNLLPHLRSASLSRMPVASAAQRRSLSALPTRMRLPLKSL